MIFSNLSNWEQEKGIYSPRFVQAVDFILNNDFSEWEPGMHPIQGEELFAVLLEYETKEKQAIMGESHFRYLDIQCVLDGEEVIAVSKNPSIHQITEDLRENQDACLYKEMIDEIDLHMKPGDFAVFLPDDIHKPGIQAEKAGMVRKIVIKLKL